MEEMKHKKRECTMTWNNALFSSLEEVKMGNFKAVDSLINDSFSYEDQHCTLRNGDSVS